MLKIVDIIEKYKSRIINISSKNKSVTLRKIYKKSHFDISSFNYINEETSLNIYDFIVNRKDGDIEIMGDPSKKLEDFKKLIQQQPPEKREDQTKKSEKIFSEMNVVVGNLKSLLANISETEKETGRNELYIGYPFAEGLCKDHTFLRAPILLFPVSLEKKGNTWKLKNSLEQPILLNKPFIFAYHKCNEQKIETFDMEFENLEQFGEDLVDGLQKYLLDNYIDLSISAPNNVNLEKKPKKKYLEIFKDSKKEDDKQHSVGTINIKKYMILGQFKISGSIYNDYTLLDGKIDESLLIKNLLLSGSNDNKQNDSDTYEKIKENEIKDSEYYFLSSLDYSQEKAVEAADKLSNLVIFGPPGTGKSQTLSNIITDSLCKGKKVLVVSQKRAAIDVVYNRLSSISNKLMIVHDSNKDKNDFFSKILSSLEYSMNYNNADFCSFDELSEEIYSKLKLLTQLGETLHVSRAFGLTLQDMYSKSKKITTASDIRLNLLNAFKNNNKLNTLTYKELYASLNKVSKDEIVKAFVEKEKMDKEFICIKMIKENYDTIHSIDFTKYLNEISQHLERVSEISKNEPFYSFWKDISKNIFEININSYTEKSIHFYNEQNSWLNEPIKSKGLAFIFNFFKNKKTERENKEKFLLGKNEHEKISNETIQELQKIAKKIVDDNKFIDNDYLAFIFNEISNGVSFEKYKNNFLNSLDSVENYRHLSSILSYNLSIENEILKFCYDNSGSFTNESSTLALEMIEEISILHQINLIEDNDKNINYINSYNTIKNEIVVLMNKKNKVTVPSIENKWNKIMQTDRNNIKLSEMERVANLKRKKWTLRKYISEFQELIFTLFPCWLLSPETVSEIIPLESGLFDIILFDEASQMFIEDSIPSIYRAKKIVVAGDDKQLKPSRGITLTYSDDDDESYDSQTQSAKDEESLLDLAKVNFQRMMLNYHYRSKYEELINFSNHAFYDGKLQVCPNAIKSGVNSLVKPIERIKVDGIWESNTNQKEAEEVVRIIKDKLLNRSENETIGVITFNIHQRDLIMNLLDKESVNDVEFLSLYQNELNRVDNNEDVGLFVKNLENVQGDERDIIIFSTAYAKNTAGRLSVNFGTLNNAGGENRLNVAISRAKKKIYLVTSIDPETLPVENATNPGPKLFKKYLQYVKYISESMYDDANNLLLTLSDSKKHDSSSLHFDSPFEVEVYEELSQIGYIVDTQIGVSGYKIDLAVYSKEKEKYILGIECDGATYHSSKSARERDVQRQIYLESMGWKIERIWSKNWWSNKNREIDRIRKLLNELL